MPFPTKHDNAVRFPNGKTGIWTPADVAAAFNMHGRESLNFLASRLVPVLPPAEFRLLSLATPTEDEEHPLVKALGVVTILDLVALLLFQATREGHGRSHDIVLTALLERTPVTAMGILLPAPD